MSVFHGFFYLRFWLSADYELCAKFIIREFFFWLSGDLETFMDKKELEGPKHSDPFLCAVLVFAGYYLRITRETCTRTIEARKRERERERDRGRLYLLFWRC